MADFPLFDDNALVTMKESPDSLPAKGYTEEQLTNYILRQCGQPVWNVELTPQQILDCINDAVGLFSQWQPVPKYGAIQLIEGQTKYLDGIDVGQGIVEVGFVEPYPTPTEIYYGNLIASAPLSLRGMGEYDAYQRWRKTWMRVTSAKPDWLYDEYRKCLWIHNPIARYRASILAFGNYSGTKTLSDFGARWVKDYALAKSRYLLGEIFAKFSGAIPGPAQNIQLDTQKRDKAEVKMKELEDALRGAQMSAPLTIDGWAWIVIPLSLFAGRACLYTTCMG